MHLPILVTTILFAVTSSLEYNLLSYSSQNEESLSICIENSEHLEEVKKLRGSDFVNIFAKHVANKLAGQVNKDLFFLEGLINLFKKQPYDFPSTSTGVFWNTALTTALLDALVRCSDDFNFKKCLDPYHMANRRLVPNFESERRNPKTTRLVNLGAVSFFEDLRSMATTPYGFIILMAFADDFVIAIANAYKTFNSNANDIRNGVRGTWQIRAINHCPLFRYYYDAKSSDVFTCGCANVDRYGTENWRILLQEVTPEEFSSVMRLFQSYPLEGRGDDIYNRYEAEGMREFERELETLLIQKYRITIFIYELRVRGILTDLIAVVDQDFIDLVPEELLQILYNDDAYIKHLASIREFLLFHLEFNHLEEEMILFLNSEVNSRGRRFVEHAKSLVYDFPSGIYAHVVSKKSHIATTITSYNITTTTTTIRPTKNKSIYRSFKNRVFKYLNNKQFGNRNHKPQIEDHGSSNTINTRTVKQETENYGYCLKNRHRKDETIYLREALNRYLKFNHCAQLAF